MNPNAASTANRGIARRRQELGGELGGELGEGGDGDGVATATGGGDTGGAG
jgi:hypothetical protein